MRCTLLSWMGQSKRSPDLDALMGKIDWWKSALLRIAVARRPDLVVLLHNGPVEFHDDQVCNDVRSLTPSTAWRVHHVKGDPLEWEDPVWCWWQVRATAQKIEKSDKIILNGSSGTPAMIFSMFWLSQNHRPHPETWTSRYLSSEPTDTGNIAELMDSLEDLRPNRPIIHPVAIHSTDMESQPASKKRRNLYELLKKAAKSDVPVLLLGEPGTGKSTIAAKIHGWSGRKDGLHIVNCGIFGDDRTKAESDLFGHLKGAFTGATEDRKGAFELAGMGTIVLDEIGTIEKSCQAVLLRALEEKRYFPLGGRGKVKEERVVQARLISASNEPLSDGQRFRRDLLDRISGIVIRVPPLRETPEEIPVLAKTILSAFNDEQTAIRGYDAAYTWKRREFDPGAMRILTAHQWPGNIRELQMTIKSAALCHSDNDNPIIDEVAIGAALADRVDTQHQTETLNMDPFVHGLDHVLNHIEFSSVEKALALSGNNKTKAARMLGLYTSDKNPGKNRITRVMGRGSAVHKNTTER